VFLLRIEIDITAEGWCVGQFMPHMLYILYCRGFELEEVGMPSPGVLLFYFLFDIGVLQNAIFKTHFLSESTLFILLCMRNRFQMNDGGKAVLKSSCNGPCVILQSHVVSLHRY
jgi:hypothetical protein